MHVRDHLEREDRDHALPYEKQKSLDAEKSSEDYRQTETERVILQHFVMPHQEA